MLDTRTAGTPGTLTPVHLEALLTAPGVSADDQACARRLLNGLRGTTLAGLAWTPAIEARCRAQCFRAWLALAGMPRLRLYRRDVDGDRASFSTDADREIPLVDGVTVTCTSNDEVASIVHVASEAGLRAVARRVGDRRTILIEAARDLAVAL